MSQPNTFEDTFDELQRLKEDNGYLKKHVKEAYSYIVTLEKNQQDILNSVREQLDILEQNHQVLTDNFRGKGLHNIQKGVKK